MEIIGTAAVNNDGASFTYQQTDLPPILPVCMKARDKGIPIPKAWPIGDDTLKDSYLFVFQLLPQTATRKYGEDGLMKDQPPAPAEGTPKCMKDDGDGGLSFKFVSLLQILSHSLV
jgi:hypothetical protein